jgi:signal transduction histidine kinase
MPLSTPVASTEVLTGLLTHLSAENGLYAQETFVSLFSCITRIFREHRLKGLVFTCIPPEPQFEAMAMALESVSDITFHRLPWRNDLGFLVVLTDRFCATLYWTPTTQDTFRLFSGGWTFHPGDAKTLATHLVGHALSPSTPLDADDADEQAATQHLKTMLLQLIATVDIDRRYDDKLNLLITSLVNGLETRNRELTMALVQVKDLNQRILDSERMAAVGQLCSVIAHEIRNPLGLVELYAKLIETQIERLTLPNASVERPPLEKNIGLIRQATQSLSQILSELTDYARPLQLNCQPLDLYQWTQDVCEFMRPLFEQHQIALTFNATGTANDDWLVNADAPRLRQALINLLKNACEATQERQNSQEQAQDKTPVNYLTVSVTLAGRQADDKRLIKVSDDGLGVPPELAEKLFTPYFSTKGNGTGLGLAHSQKIMQAHGGSISLLTPDKNHSGATFALMLPKQTLPNQRLMVEDCINNSCDSPLAMP